MSNSIKVSDSEFAEIKMLQEKVSKKTLEIGVLGIEKIEMDRAIQSFVEREKKIREEWDALRKMEKEFVDKMVEKYGDGDLNLEKGIFTPLSK